MIARVTFLLQLLLVTGQAAATAHNETLRADDYYMTMSIKFDRGKWGWVAVGAGSYIMHRSLMFVAYPGAEFGSIVLGARSTNYHDAPQYSPDLPDITIADTNFENDYHTVKFICHACNRFDGAALRSDSEALPWIWANNPYANADDNDPNKPLGRHMFYGNFFMNMRAGQHDRFDAAGSGMSHFPEISKRISVSAGLTSNLGGVKGWSVGSYVLHGSLMALAFGLLYPSGVAALLSGWNTAVKCHMWLQAGTATVALVGAAIGAWRAIRTGGPASLLGLHTALGVLISTGLMVQGVLGWRNHVHYVRTGSPAPLRTLHAYFGRGVWLAGVANATLGLAGAHSRFPRIPAAWALFVVAEVVGYAYFRRFRRAQDTVVADDDDERKGYVYDPIGFDDRNTLQRSGEEA